MGSKRRVFQFDLDGNIIRDFASASKAEETLGLGRGSVSAVCLRDKNSTKGMIFRYEDDSDDIIEFVKEKGESIKAGVGKSKKVYQYDMDGNYIREWSSVGEAKRNLNSKISIDLVCNGKALSAGGYAWSYVKKKKIEVGKRKNKRIKLSFYDYCIQKGLTDVLEEWDYNKNTISPSEISYKSNKKVSWRCPKGHCWEAQVYSRTAGRGCQKYKRQMNTSFPEQAIFFYIKKSFPDAVNRYVNRDLNINEIDIFIPSSKVGIEYDGKRWHRNIAKDKEKDIACSAAGIKLIRVREIGCPKYHSLSKMIWLKPDSIGMNTAINEVFEVLTSICKTHINSDVDIDRDYVDIVSEIKTIEVENSIEFRFPKIAVEWDYDKNNGIAPSAIHSNSNSQYWWKCSECGHSYRMLVTNRTRLGEGCPRCGQEKSRQAKIKIINQYDLSGNYIASFAGAKEAVKKTNLKYSQNINAVCERKQKTAGGFIWRYADDCDDIVAHQ